MKHFLLPLFAIAVLLFASCSPEAKIKRIVEDERKDLPEYLGEGLTMVDLFVENSSIVMEVECTYDDFGFVFDIVDEESLAEVMKDAVVESDFDEFDSDVAELFSLMVEAHYSLVYRIGCPENHKSVDAVIKPHELKQIVDRYEAGDFDEVDEE